MIVEPYTFDLNFAFLSIDSLTSLINWITILICHCFIAELLSISLCALGAAFHIQ